MELLLYLSIRLCESIIPRMSRTFTNVDHRAGKYILVKLWTQCPNSTVSVQNIVPYGTAGLRQIPDIDFR